MSVTACTVFRDGREVGRVPLALPARARRRVGDAIRIPILRIGCFTVLFIRLYYVYYVYYRLLLPQCRYRGFRLQRYVAVLTRIDPSHIPSLS